MPLIPFPDVPNAPGVPQLPAPPIGQSASVVQSPLTSSILTGDTSNDLSDLGDSDGPSWGIVDQSGNPVITPDSVVSFEYRGDAKVCNYPVEQGSFSSYNKIAVPFDIRTVMTCGGNGAMTRDQFITTLEAMKVSTDLYNFVTPDFLYENVNLVHFDYRREARRGVTLLSVEAWFEEIRESAAAIYSNPSQTTPSQANPNSTQGAAPSATSGVVASPASPSGASPQSDGQVTSTNATPAQSASTPPTPQIPAPTVLPPGYTLDPSTGNVLAPDGTVDRNLTIQATGRPPADFSQDLMTGVWMTN
jgi:hypothetical protein